MAVYQMVYQFRVANEFFILHAHAHYGVPFKNNFVPVISLPMP